MKKKNMNFQPNRARPLTVLKRPDPARQIESTPTDLLVAGVNSLLKELERRDVQIVDYDNKERSLYMLRRVHGQYCFLAAEQAALKNVD